MTAAQVVLDDRWFWLLVALMGLTSITALVASVAAWRAARTVRTALGQLEVARREVIVREREWQERNSVPWRAAEAAAVAAPVAPPIARAPTPQPPVDVPSAGSPEVERATVPPPRPSPYEVRRTPADPPPLPAPALRSDSIEDPDVPGGRPFTDVDLSPRSPAPSPPVELQTQPLSRPRPSDPPAEEDLAGDEREVHPGVFVRTPGRSRQAPPPAPAPRAEPTGPRIERLTDPDPFARIEAMDQLRGHPALAEALPRMLHDDFPVVRRHAVRALRDVGTPEATRALLDAANQDPSAEVREEAVGALEALLRAPTANPATRSEDPPGEARSNPA